MKAIRKIIIISFILGATLTIVGLVTSGGFSGVENIFFAKDNYEERRIEIEDNITNLNIEVSVKTLEVKPSETNSSYIIYNHNFKKDNVSTTNDQTNTKIKIKRNYFKFPWVDYQPGSYKYETATLYLASDKIDSLNIKISSGKLVINNLNLQDLNINVSSGSLILKDLNVLNDLTFKVSSGKTTLTNITALNLKGTSGSGNITGTNLEANLIDIKASSGSVKLNNIKGDQLNLKVSSGRVTINESLIKKSIINSSSGNVYITEKRVKGELTFKITAKSGTIYLYGTKYQQVTDTTTNLDSYEITVSSGNVKVNS